MINEALNESLPTPEMSFNYSIENEVNRVKSALSRYEWYKENGYKIKLPELVS